MKIEEIIEIASIEEEYFNDGAEEKEERIKELIQSLLNEQLDEYTKFLLDCGYVDDDVWAEKPTAIDRFKEDKQNEDNNTKNIYLGYWWIYYGENSW